MFIPYSYKLITKKSIRQVIVSIDRSEKVGITRFTVTGDVNLLQALHIYLL